MQDRSSILKITLIGALTCASALTWAQTPVMNLKQVYEAALEQDATIRA